MADILNDDPTTFASDPQIVDQPPAAPVLGIHGNEFRAALRALNRVYRAAEGPQGFNQVSVVEHGAVGDGVTDNLTAFKNAAAVLEAMGGGQLLIPPTTAGFAWQGTFEVPVGVVLKGYGLRGGLGPQSLLLPRPSAGGSGLYFSGEHRGGIEDLRIAGDEATPTGIGIDCVDAQYLKFKRFRLHHFAIGLRLSEGSTPFTAYVSAEDFEIHHCPVGVRAMAHTNACALKDGRIFWAVEDGNGVALDIADVEALAIENVQLESVELGLRVRGLVRLALRDVYFEPGPAPNAFTDIIADPNSIVRMENIQPNALASVGINASLEDAVVVDVHSQPSFGALRHHATAAERNLIENGDFHRADGVVTIPGWAPHNNPTLTEDNVDFVTAGRAYLVRRNGNPNDGLTTSFIVPESTDYVTVMVRFKNIDSRGVLFSATSSAQTANWSDGRGPDPNEWRVAAWTVPIDPAAGGLVSVYLTADQLQEGGGILVDEAWAVAGRTAAAPRAHAHRVELLDEPYNIVESLNAVANEVFPPVDITTLSGLGGAPRGVVGALLRLRGQTNAGVAGQLRTTAVHPYINMPGGTVARLDIVTDQVMVDRQLMMRGTVVSGGLNFPAGVGVSTNYFVDVVGWVL